MEKKVYLVEKDFRPFGGSEVQTAVFSSLDSALCAIRGIEGVDKMVITIKPYCVFD